MSRYKSCVWKPISGTSTVAVRKDILCLHTMVGYLTSTWNYFNRSDVGVYSHIGIGGIWGTDAGKNLDGVAWQMADTNYRAAANLNGNYRVLSVETADNAARPIQPWTPKQCNKIVEIMVEANQVDDIPLVLIPDSKPGRRGIAYHRLGCDPYRVSSGELWSSAYGKDCPVDPRIKQIPGLISRAQDIVNGSTNTGDFLMSLSATEQDEVLKAARQINSTVGPGQVSFEGTVEAILRNTQTLYNNLNGVASQVHDTNDVVGDDEANIIARVDAAKAELAAAIAALKAPSTPPTS